MKVEWGSMGSLPQLARNGSVASLSRLPHATLSLLDQVSEANPGLLVVSPESQDPARPVLVLPRWAGTRGLRPVPFLPLQGEGSELDRLLQPARAGSLTQPSQGGPGCRGSALGMGTLGLPP